MASGAAKRSKKMRAMIFVALLVTVFVLIPLALAVLPAVGPAALAAAGSALGAIGLQTAVNATLLVGGSVAARRSYNKHKQAGNSRRQSAKNVLGDLGQVPQKITTRAAKVGNRAVDLGNRTSGFVTRVVNGLASLAPGIAAVAAKLGAINPFRKKRVTPPPFMPTQNGHWRTYKTPQPVQPQTQPSDWNNFNTPPPVSQPHPQAQPQPQPQAQPQPVPQPVVVWDTTRAPRHSAPAQPWDGVPIPVAPSIDDVMSDRFADPDSPEAFDALMQARSAMRGAKQGPSTEPGATPSA